MYNFCSLPEHFDKFSYIILILLHYIIKYSILESMNQVIGQMISEGSNYRRRYKYRSSIKFRAPTLFSSFSLLLRCWQ